MIDHLTFISASAGTGKTYRITQEVLKAIANGTDPSAIVATTFTKAAATELRSRLLSDLYKEGAFEAASKLDQANISTVHGICYNLLQRFAFEAGLSPKVRIIEESDSALLLNQAIQETVSDSRRQDLYRLTSKLNQRDTRTNRFMWSDQIKRIIEAAQANNITYKDLPAMGAASADEMCAILGRSSDLSQRLEQNIKAVLDDDLTYSSTVGKTEKCRKALEYFQLNKDSENFAWSNWKTIMSSSAEPEKALQTKWEKVKNVAAQLGQHAPFQQDLRDYIELLYSIASEAGDQYKELKHQQAVADYSDLETLTLNLLRTNQRVREILNNEIDLLVVDEFQDTSPIQLALFAELGNMTDSVIWVGDVKQSIYYFRGADPNLVSQAVDGLHSTEVPLKKSWRTCPELVELTNHLFVPAFEKRNGIPAEEIQINAARDSNPALETPLEIYSIESGYKNRTNGKPKALTNPQRASVIAKAVETYLNSGDQVLDVPNPASDPFGTSRLVKADDVAILVRKHSRAIAIANELRLRGIDVTVTDSGLLETPEAVYALACLRRMIDPLDSLAAAEIISLENQTEPGDWIDDRLEFADDDENRYQPWSVESSPALQAIHNYSYENQQNIALLSPLAAFDLALSISNAIQRIEQWGPSADRSLKRQANIQRLRNYIEDYQERCLNFGIPAGFNGLFGYLEDLAEREEDKIATSSSTGAITISTYHAAKGLEWPVVMLEDLDEEARGSLFDTRITSPADDAFDRSDPLAGRELRTWINPFNLKKQYGRSVTHPLLNQLESSAQGKAGQQIAEDESLRLLYVGFTRARDKVILIHDIAKPNLAWLDELGKNTAKALLTSPDSSFQIEAHFEKFVYQPTPPVQPSPTLTLHTATPAPASGKPSLPAIINPSKQAELPNARIGKAHTLPSGRINWQNQPADNALGDAIHQIIAAECLNPHHADREQRIQLIMDANGIGYAAKPATILQSVDHYFDHLASTYPDAQHKVEVPFTHYTSEGQRVTGLIDHLVITDEKAIIIDHKIFPGKRDYWQPKALSFSGQLKIYAEVIESEYQLPTETWIHLATVGELIEVV